MRRNRAVLACILALIASLALLVATPTRARADDLLASGTWGTCPWEITEDGTLTIHPGTGESGSIPWSSHADSITSIVIVEEDGSKAVAPADSSKLFSDMHSVVTIDATGLDVSSVTDMSYMFSDTSDPLLDLSRLERVDITGWNTSNVTTMNNMFSGNHRLDAIEGLSALNVSSVTDMASMLEECRSLRLPDLSSWDVSSVTDMSSMFRECQSIWTIDLSAWDVSSVTDMSSMFFMCSKLTTIDLSAWDVSSVTNMSQMFICPALTSIDLSGWDTSSVTNMSAMFSNCVSLEHLDVPSWGWDTSSVATMNEMFLECISLVSLDLSTWDTPSLGTAEDMFRECESLVALDLSGWTTAPDTKMARMFSDCSKLKVIYAGSGWTTYYSRMEYGSTFLNCTSLVGGNGTVYESRYQTAHYAHIDTPDNPGMLTDSSQRPARTSISGAQISVASGSIFTGAGVKPEVTVMLNGVTLTRGTDFAVAYAHNVAAGTATVTVYGIGTYCGNASTTFEIGRRSIEGAYVYDPGAYGCVYDGTEQTFDVEVQLDVEGLVDKELDEGKDFTLAFSDNVNAGTATLTISGIGNFSGTIVEEFTIGQASLDSAAVTLDTTRYVYDGTEKRPAMSVMFDGRELSAGIDYRIEYGHNVDASEYSIYAFARGIGNYKDYARAEFYIDPRPITEATISPIPDQEYDGYDIEPDVEITFNGVALVEDTDYTLEYRDNSGVGTATVTITGKDNFSGTTTASFRIYKDLIDIADAEFYIDGQIIYTGSEVEPDIMIFVGDRMLEEGDYTASYANNVNAGTATLTITGRGDFTGTATYEFEILPEFINAATVAEIPDQTWTGAEIRPEVTLTYGGVELVAGTDYVVTGYHNNVDVGVGTVNIEGRGNFDSRTEVEFNIVEGEKTDISGAVIELEYSSVEFDGNAHEPTVTVTLGSAVLQRDADYEVGYADNVNVGTAKVTVAGIGRYAGEAFATFEIVEAGETPEPVGPFFLDADPADTRNHGAEVDWLGRTGISTGWEVAGGREFRGLQNVKRCDFAAFLYRLADLSDDGARNDSIALTEAEVASVLENVNDCSPSTSHAAEIAWLISTGISKGWSNPDGTVSFKPMANVARQDMAAFLYRFADLDDDGVQNQSPAMGSQTVTFSDVRHGDTTNHADEVEWLASVGVTKGWDMGNGTFQFRGTNNVARQDMAAFMYRLYTYMKSQG